MDARGLPNKIHVTNANASSERAAPLLPPPIQPRTKSRQRLMVAQDEYGERERESSSQANKGNAPTRRSPYVLQCAYSGMYFDVRPRSRR